jgi:hypothetical protein
MLKGSYVLGVTETNDPDKTQADPKCDSMHGELELHV